MIYFVSYENEFCSELRILLKWESGFCLENATMIQIQDMFENEKPDIVLKTVKGFNKKTPFIILIPENSFELGIVVLVVFNKMLVIVLIIDFYSRYGPGSLKPSLSICAHF